jgi:hypothetical protein
MLVIFRSGITPGPAACVKGVAMYERTYAPGFHDLIFGMLRDAGIVPNICQTAGECQHSSHWWILEWVFPSFPHPRSNTALLRWSP